jgi:putative ABC transport system substrate-binding protein
LYSRLSRTLSARDLVASLGRPNANVTGLSAQATDIVGKRLEFLQERVPR